MRKAVLSIDGGGVKGMISAMVLVALEEQLKKYSKDENAKISDYFDLIAGTSTGAIIAALLLCPGEDGRSKYSAKEIFDLYLKRAKVMFQKKKGYPLSTCFGLFGSKYSNVALKNELDEYFGDLTIANLRKPCLLASFDLSSGEGVFFNSMSSKADRDRDFMVKDIVLASCAAPTYFPPVLLKKAGSCSGCMIDGGVAANNPSLCALIESLKLPDAVQIKDTYLLSIGNVQSLRSYSCGRAKSWGVLGYAVPVLHILLETGEDIVDYQLQKLYGNLGVSDQYVRIQAETNKQVPGMDNTKEAAIRQFLEIGRQLVKENEFEICRMAKLLVYQKNTKG